MGLAKEGDEVVFADGVERDVSDYDDFVVLDFEGLLRCSAGSSRRPLQISSYMRATRFGVSMRPSRSGSSPIAARISFTAAAIRSWSTLNDSSFIATSGLGESVVCCECVLKIE